MATTGRTRRLEPCYKRHAVVCDTFLVVRDVEVTTGEVNERQVMLERLDATAATTRVAGSYAGKNEALEEMSVEVSVVAG